MKEIFEVLNFNPTDFLFQFANISILIYFIHKYFFKKVLEFIDARNQEVNDTYKDIDAAWEDIKTKENHYNSKLKKVDGEATDILTKAKADGLALKEKLEAEARTKAEEELQRARMAIESEKNMALAEIQANISDLVVQGAEAVLKKEIDKGEHRSMVDDFVAGLKRTHE